MKIRFAAIIGMILILASAARQAALCGRVYLTLISRVNSEVSVTDGIIETEPGTTCAAERLSQVG